MDGENNYGYRLNCPTAIHLTDESIYIGDYNRVKQFDRMDNNNFVKEWGYGIIGDVGGITFIGNKCFVTDYGNNCVYIFE